MKKQKAKFEFKHKPNTQMYGYYTGGKGSAMRNVISSQHCGSLAFGEPDCKVVIVAAGDFRRLLKAAEGE